MSTPETRAVQARYARRDSGADAQRYSLVDSCSEVRQQSH